jgi:hypothetical protein
LTLLLLAQCRYESIIFIPIVGLALVRFLLRKGFFQNASGSTRVTPVFFIPLLWQRKGFEGTLEMLVSKVEHEAFLRWCFCRTSRAVPFSGPTLYAKR